MQHKRKSHEINLLNQRDLPRRFCRQTTWPTGTNRKKSDILWCSEVKMRQLKDKRQSADTRTPSKGLTNLNKNIANNFLIASWTIFSVFHTAKTCALIQPNVKPWRLTFLIIIVAPGAPSAQAELLSSASNPLNFSEFTFLKIWHGEFTVTT